MYLVPADYKKQIQTDNLMQVISSDLDILASAEATAIEEATSYLIQKYLLSGEFAAVLLWDTAVLYSVGQRVYYHPPVFNPATVYVTGDIVSYNDKTYSSIAGSAAHAFAPSEWTDTGIKDNQLFFAKAPAPIFNVYDPYYVGDQVYYNGKVYTALQNSIFPSRPPSIEYGQYENVPLPNPFPGNPGSIYFWGNGVTYNVPVNTAITNATYWTIGDNRSQQLVTYVIDITLYHVHSRISPRNIPDLRIKRYDDAIKWLKNAARGEDITAAMPVKQPRQGGRIRYGGNIKHGNSY